MPRASSLRVVLCALMAPILGMSECPDVFPFFEIRLAPFTPGPYERGDLVTVRATVGNGVAADASYPGFQLDTSPGYEVLAMQSDGGLCRVPLAKCLLGLLGPGESSVVDLAIRMTGTQTEVPVTARVVSPTDPDPSDNVVTQNLDGLPATVERIEVGPTQMAIAVGRKARLAAVGHYDIGPPGVLRDEVSWRLISGSGASVDPATGVLTALAGSVGARATIAASWGVLSDSVEVEVQGGGAQTLSVECDDLDGKLGVGASMQCFARLAADGVSNLPAVSDQTAFADWTCIGPAAYCGDAAGSKGRVRCNQPGTVTVEARLGGSTGVDELRANWHFECLAAQITGTWITPRFARVPVGGTIPFSVARLYADGRFDAGSGDALRVGDFSQGFFTSTGPDPTPFRYRSLTTGTNTIMDGSGDTVSVAARMAQARLEGPPPIRIQVGESRRLTATLIGEDGARCDLINITEVEWSSADGSVANVTLTPMGRFDGAGRFSTDVIQAVVRGLAPGSTTLVAKSYGTGLEVHVPIEVVALDSLAIVPAEGGGAPVQIPRGHARQLRLIATYTNGTTEDLTDTAVWGSSNDEIAVLASTQGLVRGVETGIASIAARLGDTNLSIPVVVGGASPSNVFVSGQSSLRVGTRGRTFVGANFDDGTFVDVTGRARVDSDDETVAVASNGRADPSIVYALQPGLVRVLASLGGIQGTQQVNVHAGALNSLQLQPSGDLVVGEQRVFSLFGVFVDGGRTFTQDLSLDAVFESSAPDVVAVSNQPGSEGGATARSEGSATVSGCWTDPDGVQQKIFLPLVVK